MLELIFLALALFLGGLLFTLPPLRLTRSRLKVLRFPPLMVTAAPCELAWYDHPSGGWFSDLAGLADFAAGLLVLLGWALAFLIVFRKRRKRKCQNGESSGS